jgi:steroid delta-isomerase-like uncharacterized protein
MMSRDELSNLTYKWISLWNAPVDWKMFDEIHADNFKDMSPGGRGDSKEDFADGLKYFLEAFPDLKTKVEDLVIEESANRVAVRWSAVGTNKTRYLGIGPTNRQTNITGIEIIEFANGRITRRWGEWDISDHHD